MSHFILKIISPSLNGMVAEHEKYHSLTGKNIEIRPVGAANIIQAGSAPAIYEVQDEDCIYPIYEQDSAYLLNSDGKTIKIINRPM